MQIIERKLKMLYNIAIETSRINLKVVLGINEIELKKFSSAYLQGKPSVTINGKKIIIEHPELVKIFDVARTKNQYDSASKIAIDFQNWSNTFNNKEINLVTLREFGEDITSIYITGDWGSEAKEVDDTTISQTKISVLRNNTQNSGKIFISHSNANQEIVTKFCDLILHNGLNINTTTEIFNTSLPGSKPKTGKDFRESIKYELLNAKLVLQFISKEYRVSQVCLNEMGAAWVLSDNVIPLIIEKDEYEIGFIHSTSQQCQLTRESDILKVIDELKEKKIIGDFKLERLNSKIKEFVDWLNDVQKKETNHVSVIITPEVGIDSLSPLFKLKNKNGTYLKSGKYYHLFPDDNITLKLLGYGNYQVTELSANDSTKVEKGANLQSVQGAQIHRITNTNSSWIILNNKRHFIPDSETLKHLLERCSSQYVGKIEQIALEKFPQADDLESVEKLKL